MGEIGDRKQETGSRGTAPCVCPDDQRIDGV